VRKAVIGNSGTVFMQFIGPLNFQQSLNNCTEETCPNYFIQMSTKCIQSRRIYTYKSLRFLMTFVNVQIVTFFSVAFLL